MIVAVKASGHGTFSPDTAAGAHKASIRITIPVTTDVHCVIGVSTPTAPRVPPASMASAVSAAKMVGGATVPMNGTRIRAAATIR